MNARSLAPLFVLLFVSAACASTVDGGGDDDDSVDGSGGAGGADATNEATTGGQGGGGGTGQGGEGGAGGGVLAEECNEPAPAYLEEECDEFGGPICDEYGWSCGDTPLVLSFDGAEPTYATSDLVGFDLTGIGQSLATDWPAAATPWLALDRDGDGSIADGTELFGSAVRLGSGLLATHGFEALAELDANHDGRIDASDPRFGELRVWADANADRQTGAAELTSAASGERRIVSIDLCYRVQKSCDARGNCGIERAAFVWADASGDEHLGEIIDVHLPRRMR